MRAVRHALWGVGARPWRSFSLVLSLAAAVACVSFSASVLEGFSREMQRLAFGDYGRALVVRANPLVPSRRGPPTLNDRAVLLDTLAGVDSSAAWVEGVASMRIGAETRIVPVYGVLGDFTRELDSELRLGRWLTPEELSGFARACLVGPGLASDLDRGADLIGANLVLDGAQCTVVGVLDRGRSRPAARFANGVIAPFATARRHLATPSTNDAPSLRTADWLTFFMAADVNMEDARYQADRIMRKLAGVPLSRESPFIFDDPGALLREQEAQQSLLSRLLFTVCGAALLASVVGYSGIVLASTLARKREIALRLAMGATRRDVWTQCLLEQVALGLAASLVGLAVGGVGAGLAGVYWEWPVHFSWGGALLSAGTGMALGGLVGVAAANIAARTPPALAAKG